MRFFRTRFQPDEAALNVIAVAILGLVALVTIFPFVVLLVSSFTSERFIINHGYALFPRELSVESYALILRNPQKIARAYGVTLFITSFGTLSSLFLSSMAAYTLSRREVRYRNSLAFFLYFTTLFSGGLAPTYIIVSTVFHLKNTLAVLVLGPMFSVLNILILRNYFMNSVPSSLVESARMDGAGDFTIFVRIILPLTTPVLASIGLFTALYYWNDWWTAMLYVERERLFPLQYVLYQILSSVTVAANIVNNVATLNMPKETLKLAMTVVSIGPIVLAYPFVQRYFVKGITLGAVKG